MRLKQTTTDDTDESNDEIRMSNDEGMTKQPVSPRLPPGARMNTDAKGFFGRKTLFGACVRRQVQVDRLVLKPMAGTINALGTTRST